MQVYTQFTQELEQVWNRLNEAHAASYPFTTYGWQKAWYETLGADYSLHVFVNDNECIIPLVVKDSVAHFGGGEEGGDYLEAVGEPSAVARAWPEALTLLRQAGATAIDLRNIPDGSPTITYFQTLPHATAQTEDTTPMLPLPESFDEYASALDRKSRHELRRKLRRFDEQYPQTSLEAVWGSDTDIPLLLELMKLDTDKETFLTPAMEQFFLRLPEVVGGNLLQLKLLKDNAVIATTLAFRQGTSLLLYNSGYRHEFVGAGFYLKAKAIAWAIDNSFTTYNFLQGNERYKYELGGKDFFVYRITMPLP